MGAGRAGNNGRGKCQVKGVLRLGREMQGNLGGGGGVHCIGFCNVLVEAPLQIKPCW